MAMYTFQSSGPRVGACYRVVDASQLWLSPHFFFQAEDGIRDLYVTGVQTCALPICRIFLTTTRSVDLVVVKNIRRRRDDPYRLLDPAEIGRASCRERVCISRLAATLPIEV